MAEVRKLTNAERCSLFLLDPDQQDLVAKVFDGLSTKEVGNVYVNLKNSLTRNAAILQIIILFLNVSRIQTK